MKVFGIIDFSLRKSEIEVILDKMAKSFEIEGFSSQFLAENGIGAGHLSNPEFNLNRPAINSDRSLSAFSCGRIFNIEEKATNLLSKGHKFETDSTAEFLLHSFEEYGEGFISELNGIFIAVLLNWPKKELTIINDRYGMQPLYFYKDEEVFIFASEIKAILGSERVRKEIDWNGWRDLFSYGYVLGDRTFFRNISTLPNASILSIKNNNINCKFYWNYEKIQVNHTHSVSYFVEQGVSALRNSVLRQTNCLLKVQVPLSGGYDSRSIICALKQFTNVNFMTFTSSLHGTGLKDVKYARLLSERLNIPNVQISENKQVYQKYFIDLAFSLDCLSFEHLWACPLASRLMPTIAVLDGIAGDLVFREVPSLPFDKLGRFGRDESISLIFRNSLVDNSKLLSFFTPDIQEKIRPTDFSIRQEIDKIKCTDYLFFTFFIRNRTKNSISLVSNNIFCRFSSKAPCLFPFLDNELVELGMSIPPDIKVRNMIYLRILRRAFPNAMTIPTTRDVSLGNKVRAFLVGLIRIFLARPTFANTVKRFSLTISRDFPLLKFVTEILVQTKLLVKFPMLSPNQEDIEYLKNIVIRLEFPTFIKKQYLLDQLAYYEKNNYDCSNFLVPLTNFCLWYNLFFKNNPDTVDDLKNRIT
jgi:asparagine synthase (glutamine-hydrolysing)